MKKVQLLLFLFCCLMASSIKAESEIDLLGDFASTSTRSLLKPIQAFITDQSIEVDFNSTVGTLVVTIYDEVGNIVYLQSVNGTAGEQLLIDSSDWGEGRYHISFTNSLGGCISGDFDISR